MTGTFCGIFGPRLSRSLAQHELYILMCSSIDPWPICVCFRPAYDIKLHVVRNSDLYDDEHVHNKRVHTYGVTTTQS